VPEGVEIDPRRARPGDRILISGTIADHGIAILSVRDGLEFETKIASDTAALNGLVEALLAVTRDVRVLRDPTRGGLASALCEIARSSGQGIQLVETAIPVREDVSAACEILGLDPLHVANEGKLVAFVPEADAEAALAAMRAHPLGRDAAIIGEVTAAHAGMVSMKTRIGGSRVVDMLAGEQLPRIC
jgi:hydrogenase expression/formation protein HypE